MPFLCRRPTVGGTTRWCVPTVCLSVCLSVPNIENLSVMTDARSCYRHPADNSLPPLGHVLRTGHSGRYYFNSCCYLKGNGPIQLYCAPVLHYALTKAQSDSLEAVQKRAIHITHNLTRGMPYSSMLLHVNLDSLAARREDLSRRYYESCLLSSQPPSSTQIHRYHL